MFRILLENLHNYYYNAMANAILVLDDEEEEREKDLSRIEYCAEFFENFNNAFKESLPNASAFVLEIVNNLGNHSASNKLEPKEIEELKKMDELVDIFIDMKKGIKINKDRIDSSLKLIFQIKDIFS